MNIQPAVIILVGVVISVVGVVISGIGAFLASQQQTSSALNLLNKSEEIARLNQELANSVIGGDSFCYLNVANIDSVKNIGIFVVVHRGKDPLYDLNAMIVDLEKKNQIKGKPSLATVRQTSTDIPLGTLIPSSVRMLDQITLGNGDTRRFSITFSARNGFFIQVLRLKKIHGKWVHATKVLRENKVIYEEVDDEFPRTAEGNVEWDEFGKSR